MVDGTISPSCCLQKCSYGLANEMRYITDLAIFFLCVSRITAAADDHPGGINYGVLAKCKGPGVSHYSFFVHLRVLGG